MQDDYDLAPQSPPPVPRRPAHQAPAPGQPPTLNYANPRGPAAPRGVQSAHPAVAAVAIANQLAVRAQGKLLLVRRGTPLPERCVKCNDAATAMVRLSVAQSESDTGTYMGGFIPFVGPVFRLMWVINHIRTRDSESFRVGLCARHRTQRWIGWAITLAAAPLGGVLFYLAARDDFATYPRLPVIAITLTILMLLVGWALQRTLSLVSLDNRQLTLSGAGRPFLESLPKPMDVHAPRMR